MRTEYQPSLLMETGALVLRPGAPFCCFELTGEPVGKGRPRFRIVSPRFKPPFVHVYPPPETAAYEKTLKQTAAVVMRGRQPTSAPLMVRMDVFLSVPPSWPERRRMDALIGAVRPSIRGTGDADNYLKILDALNEIVWVDDCQIVTAHVNKTYSDRPGLRIEVREFMSPIGE